MVAEDHEPAAGPEQVEGGREAGLERLELLVDRDAQRLEDPGRGVGPARLARIGRRDLLDQGGKSLGRVDRRGPARVDDRPGDPRRLRLLAVATEERGQLGGVERRQQGRGGDAAAGVEAHVERPAGAEPEPAVGVGQLVAGKPEVEEAAVDGLESRFGRDGREVLEVRPAQDEAVAEACSEATVRSGDGRPIGIEAEEAAIRVGRLQDPLGVPTAAQGGVDLKAARRWSEHHEDLLHQHRHMPILHLSSVPNDRIPSGSWKRMWWR